MKRNVIICHTLVEMKPKGEQIVEQKAICLWWELWTKNVTNTVVSTETDGKYY